MKVMKTTIKELRNCPTCKVACEKLICNITENYPDPFESLPKELEDREITILEILESNGPKDAFQALKTQDYLDYCLILADIVESVLPYFKRRYPTNNKLEKAIQGIRDYKAKKITKEEFGYLKDAAIDTAADTAVDAANSSAHANVCAATVTDDAEDDAAANAAVDAVNAIAVNAAADAVVAAVNAATAAPIDAAYAAAYSVRYSAYANTINAESVSIANATATNAQKEQWKISGEILRKHSEANKKLE